MLFSHERAFALRGDPFNPRKLPDVEISNPIVMDTLMKRPLQVHLESKLMDLFCREVGDFAETENDFKFELQYAGYDFEQHSRSPTPFIFLVLGSVGTGKSTLINVMRHWIQHTAPNGAQDWYSFNAWESESPFTESNYQINQLTELENRIIASSDKGDYCCILADNLVPGVEVYALELFVKLRTQQRVIIMFLASSEPDLIDKSWEDSHFDVQPFRTRELSTDDAIRYMKHRTSYFRHPEAPAVLNHFPLFPFDEANLRDAVQTQYEGGLVTIRQLNLVLSGAMKKEMKKLDASFDVTNLSRDEAQARTINLVGYYEEVSEEMKRATE